MYFQGFEFVHLRDQSQRKAGCPKPENEQPLLTLESPAGPPYLGQPRGFTCKTLIGFFTFWRLSRGSHSARRSSRAILPAPPGSTSETKKRPFLQPETTATTFALLRL
jgi:hypothetical protein